LTTGVDEVLTLLLTILPLAIGAAVSPTLLMIEIFALSSSTNPVRKGWLVALGAAVMLLGFAVVGVIAGVGIPHRTPHHGIDATIAISAAILLGWLIVHQFVNRKKASDKPSLSQRLDHASGRAYFVSGLLVMLVNFSTLILFFPAIRLITKSNVALGDGILTVVLLFVVTLLPVWLPAAIASVLGQRAKSGLGALNRFVTKRSFDITIGIEVIFFVYFVVKACLEFSML
jgi:uncharacterized membrane protein YfcA